MDDVKSVIRSTTLSLPFVQCEPKTVVSWVSDNLLSLFIRSLIFRRSIYSVNPFMTRDVQVCRSRYLGLNFYEGSSLLGFVSRYPISSPSFPPKVPSSTLIGAYPLLVSSRSVLPVHDHPLPLLTWPLTRSSTTSSPVPWLEVDSRYCFGSSRTRLWSYQF